VKTNLGSLIVKITAAFANLYQAPGVNLKAF